MGKTYQHEQSDAGAALTLGGEREVCQKRPGVDTGDFQSTSPRCLLRGEISRVDGDNDAVAYSAAVQIVDSNLSHAAFFLHFLTLLLKVIVFKGNTTLVMIMLQYLEDKQSVVLIVREKYHQGKSTEGTKHLCTAYHGNRLHS